MNIALTGGSGLIGQYLIDALQKENHALKILSRKKMPSSAQVEWLEGDIQDVKIIEKLVDGADVVIHLAALISFYSRDEESVRQTNVRGTENIVNVCLHQKTPHLIYIGSTSAIAHASIEGGLRGYGQSKHEGEREVLRAREEGLKTSILHPALVLAKPSKHNQLFAALQKGVSFFWDGKFRITDVRDIVRIMLQIIHNSTGDERCAVFSEEVSIRDFFTHVCQRLHSKPPTIQLPLPLLHALATGFDTWNYLTKMRVPITPQTLRLTTAKSDFTKYPIYPFSYHTFSETLDWCLEK